MEKELVELVVKVTRDILDEQGLAADGEIVAATKLFGESGLLDSMALVSLVIAVEQAIEEQFKVAVRLADEKALSQRHSPYRSVATLAAYARQEIDSRGGNG
jgi:acyl carrier protein